MFAPLLATALSGCSIYHLAVPRTVQVHAIEFHVADDANDDTPIAVDIAYLSNNSALVDEVAQMTAEDWFTRKQQLRRDFRDDLDVVSWELVPGTFRPREQPEPPKVNHAAFLFARYRAPGAHRYRLTEAEEDIVVKLEGDDFSLAAR
jgi:type VI secretion system protein